MRVDYLVKYSSNSTSSFIRGITARKQRIIQLNQCAGGSLEFTVCATVGKKMWKENATQLSTTPLVFISLASI